MVSVLSVSMEGRLFLGRISCRCAVGRSGGRAGKKEGDGATPLGRFVLRGVLYRPDRVRFLETLLPCSVLRPEDGWCDDPAHPAYNRPVRLPFPARFERLWREDGLYDVVGVLGYNDAPPCPGVGSAVFFHIAHPDYRPTEGCVAVSLADMRTVLANLEKEAVLEICGPEDLLG